MPNWLYVLVEWVIPLAMVPVVARGRRPFVAISWLAFIFAVPWFGLPMYLLLGERGLRRDARAHEGVRRAVESLGHRRGEGAYAAPGTGASTYDSVPAVTSELYRRGLDGENPVLRGNTVDLLEDEAVVDRLVAEIEAAQRHVHMIFFIFAPDATGERVADALLRASRRGVRCRLLVDAWASRKMMKELAPRLREGGVTVHRVLRLRAWRRPLRRLDIRNHRKIAVVDGRVAFTGSTNIHDPDFELEAGVWHQVSARVTGPAVASLQTIFAEDWYFATDELLDEPDLFPPADARGEALVQVVADGPTYPADLVQHLWIEMLNRAERRVVITTPYFVPDEPVLVALRLAALRGADVHLVLPRRSDRRIADEAARAYFGALLEVGARVHLHPEGLLHAKTVTVDDQVGMLGTANLDRRSLFLNYEVVLLLYDEASVRGLAAAQERYLAEAPAVDAADWALRPARERVLQDTLKLFSPLL